MSFYNTAKNKRKQPTPETSSLPRKLLFPSFPASAALPQIEREQQPSENEGHASDGRNGSQNFDPCYGECVQTSRKNDNADQQQPRRPAQFGRFTDLSCCQSDDQQTKGMDHVILHPGFIYGDGVGPNQLL